MIKCKTVDIPLNWRLKPILEQRIIVEEKTRCSLFVMKLHCLNKCKLVQDLMKYKTRETPVRVLQWTYKVFGHMRSNPQDFETCIAHIVKFSQDLISSEMLFPQLRTKFLLKRHPKPQWYKLYRKSSRRWALTDLRFHLMLSLYTSWEKYYGAESVSSPVVHGDFGCNVTCQACRENSPRMTIGAWGESWVHRILQITRSFIWSQCSSYNTSDIRSCSGVSAA